MTAPNHRPPTLATLEDVRGVLRSLLELSEIVHARIEAQEARK